ncbi:MAG: ABC transporter permease [Acetobacteraceae bacterium]|nr:ABC transporter permease [Acetobacteraceae bacterium]
MRAARSLLGSYGGAIYLFLYAPIALLVLFSFNASPSGTLPISGFTLRWYRELFDDYFLIDAMLNSLTVAAIATPVATIVGGLCAYALARTEFRLKPLVSSTVLMPMIVPGLLLGAAMLLILRPLLGVPLSLWTAACGHVVVTTPYAVMAIGNRLYGYDRRLDAAASDLGAPPWRVLRHVTIPLLMPGILAAALIVFTVSLDTFGITFFTIGSDGTLPMYIWSQVELGIRPTVNALGTLLIAVSILLLSLAQLLLRRR